MQCHGMSDSRTFTVRSDDPHFAQPAQGFREDCQPGGMYSVIVCDQNQRCIGLRHKKSCAGQLPSLR